MYCSNIYSDAWELSRLVEDFVRVVTLLRHMKGSSRVCGNIGLGPIKDSVVQIWLQACPTVYD